MYFVKTDKPNVFRRIDELGDVKQTLEKIIQKNPEHISVYSLIIEEGTTIEKLINENKLQLPDEETERIMYWTVVNELKENGYNRRLYHPGPWLHGLHGPIQLHRLHHADGFRHPLLDRGYRPGHHLRHHLPGRCAASIISYMRYHTLPFLLR